MKKYYLASLMLLVACGGGGGGDGDGNGGGDYQNSITGRWQGQLFQNEGQICSDGATNPEGSGLETRVISVEIAGGDDSDTTVVLNDNGCIYTGQRLEEGSAILDSSQSECDASVVVSEITSNSFVYQTVPRSPQPDSQGGVTCTIMELGTLGRE